MKKSIAVMIAMTLLLSFAMFGCGKDDGRVRIDISASSLSKSELADLDGYAEENGFESVKLNDDGTISVVIGDTDYDILLYKIGVAVIQNVYGLMNSDTDYPYIKNIDRNKDFSEMKIDVVKSEFEKDKTSDAMVDLVGNSCLVYQNYTQKDKKDQQCVVIVRDTDTKEVLLKKTFKQD